MFTNYDRAKRLEYIRNLSAHTKATSPAFVHVISRFEDTGEPCLEKIPCCYKELKALSYAARRKLINDIIASIEKTLKELRRYKSSRIKKNIDLCAEYFGLSQIEREVLEFTFRIMNDDDFEGILEEYQNKAGFKFVEIYAIALGQPESRIKMALSPQSRLMRHKLIQKEYSLKRAVFKIPDPLVYALDKPARAIDEIRSNVLGKCLDKRLDWADFTHMGDMKDTALKLLNSAIKNREKGINILLYGPPGTGKTEFCRTLAAKAGLDLYAATDLDDEGCAATGHERLEDLKLKQQWIPDNEKAVILFDEMEDIGLGKIGFRSFSRTSDIGGKSFFNRLLEENAVPVLWTCNDAWWFDEAFIRRMSLIIELKAPRTKHMKALLEKTAVQSDYHVDENTAEEIAGYESVSPGVFANALRVTKLTDGGEETLKSGVQSIIKAMNGGMPVKSKTVSPGYEFRQDISNTDIPLQELSGALARCENMGFSLCLHGPPGTGKSAYARFLAKNMGMDVLFKRASDLLSMWVGETEKNIAAAFEEAIETKSFLIIDEADSFLQDRSGAHRSWEVTRVNEVLTWMENHPLPVAFTTNFFDSLDSASLRRFTFKIRFDYLDTEQVETAFTFFFGMRPPEGLKHLDLLTPGDFANVKKKADIMGFDKDSAIICKMLTEECELKPGHKNPIGFGV